MRIELDNEKLKALSPADKQRFMEIARELAAMSVITAVKSYETNVVYGPGVQAIAGMRRRQPVEHGRCENWMDEDKQFLKDCGIAS